MCSRVCFCSHLNILQVYFDQADFLRFRHQLDPCDAGELRERGQYAQLVVDYLAHAVACPHQQGDRRLPVLELKVGEQRKGG